ncbi:hypothetical protein Tco_1179613 [Tanacetum coccineum]
MCVLRRMVKVVRTYYGGRISDEDLKKALLFGNEKRRMLKKRALSLNSSSKNTVSDTALNSDIEDDINSDPTHASAKQNGSIDVSSDDVVIATCSSKLSLLGHGLHGKQVVDYLLKEHGEDGIHEFCQRWRQVFVEAINPRFLPAGWDVTHRREFGDFSVYNPANKGSPFAAKDLTV